jgi:hypothetical protein
VRQLTAWKHQEWRNASAKKEIAYQYSVGFSGDRAKEVVAQLRLVPGLVAELIRISI